MNRHNLCRRAEEVGLDVAVGHPDHQAASVEARSVAVAQQLPEHPWLDAAKQARLHFALDTLRPPANAMLDVYVAIKQTQKRLLAATLVRCFVFVEVADDFLDLF